MKVWKYEIHKPDEITLSDYELAERRKDNVELVDTAGFEPLKVKMQRMIENGIINRLYSDDFDIDDVTKMYMDDDYKITSEDDLEDIQEKLLRRAMFVENLRQNYDNNDVESVDKQKKTVDNESTKTTSDETE